MKNQLLCEQILTNVGTDLVKARIVELDMSVARQWLSKRIAIATNMCTTMEELLKVVSSVLTVLILYWEE
jgi:hypothetical protein